MQRVECVGQDLRSFLWGENQRHDWFRLSCIALTLWWCCSSSWPRG